MNRIDKGCCGDCAQCALLADGKVDMVPCALDQILRRLMRLEKKMDGKPENLAADGETK